MKPPETNISLLARLENMADADAWRQFVEIYRPIIMRMATAKGMQRADAEDLAQGVLLSVSGAIENWEPNGSARFRTWLKRVTDNAILNALSRRRPDQPAGAATDTFKIDNQIVTDGPDTDLLRNEYRREVMHWAARAIRQEFSEETWSAFWMTAVEGLPADEVGKKLGRKRGSVYTARCRVMRRLVEKANELEGDEVDQ